MNNHQSGFGEITAKTIVVHTVTYTLVGMLAFFLAVFFPVLGLLVEQ